MADNPGMVIRVAADIADAEAAFTELAQDAAAMSATLRDATADTVGATDGLEAAVVDTTAAYNDLGRAAPGDLDDVADATAAVDDATEGVNTSMLALGAGIAVMAATAIGALVSLAYDGVKAVASEVWDLIDSALGLTDAWHAFEDDVSDTIRTTGVLQAGIDSLIRSFELAFGVDRAGAVRLVAMAINAGAIEALRLADAFVTVAEWGARAFADLIEPVDIVQVAIANVGEKLSKLDAYLAELRASMPGASAEWKAYAVEARGAADSMTQWLAEARATRDAHAALRDGQGALAEQTAKIHAAIDDARVAMQKQQEAAAAAAASVGELADANAGLVQGSGEAAVALYTQNEQLEKMDAWSRSIKNQDPLKYLLTGLSKAKPEFDAAAFGLADVTTNAILLGENFTKTLTPLEKTRASMRGVGQDAIDMSDDVRFAAEVVADATLSWSDAMDLVRQGKGTMGGTIGTPTKPAGMSNMEFQQMQSDPRTWEILHGYDWAQRGGTGATWNWLDWAAPAGGGGATTTQNINVNTVMGDKYEIARIVKDALAEDWRSTGARA